MRSRPARGIALPTSPHRLMLFAVCLLVLARTTPSGAQAVVALQPKGESADKAKRDMDPRTADRAAVRAAMESFTKAFSSRDAKALADHWTTEGEFQNSQGATVHGREALAKTFAEFFTRTPEISASVTPDSLRFLSQDLAIEEGTVRVRRGVGESAAPAHYVAHFAREEGKWRLAALHETTHEDRVSIEDLAWLIGTWKTIGVEGSEISTQYSWDPNKHFILVDFSIKEEGISLSGRQVIGVNPRTEALHTWTFESDGGVAESEWSRDGDHWALDVVGTLADGRTLTETNILRRVNDDTFTFQSANRMLDGEAIPDLAPVKVTRVKLAKQDGNE